jgi:hypothetical protein
MVGELKSTGQHPAVLQAGLIRWDQSRFRMQAFVTTELPGKELNFKPIAGDLSGYHRFAIAANSSTIELRMDDKTLMSAPRATFFDDRALIYLKIAAEVFAVGGEVSGVVDDITFKSAAAKETSAVSHAAFEDRGLRFVCKGKGKWQATGHFDPKLTFTQYVPPPSR